MSPLVQGLGELRREREREGGGCTYYIYMLLFDLHTSPHFSSLKWGGEGQRKKRMIRM